MRISMPLVTLPAGWGALGASVDETLSPTHQAMGAWLSGKFWPLSEAFFLNFAGFLPVAR